MKKISHIIPPNWQFTVTVGALCCVWYIESSCSNILNKILFRSYPYPLTISMSSLIATALFSIPLMRYWKIPVQKLKFGCLVKWLLPLATGKILALSFAYTSIWKVPVSYAHTVKATMPLFAVMCARVILGEVQTVQVYVSLFPIICGVVIATMTELSFTVAGLLSALASTFTYALLNAYVKKVLQETNLHHIRLLSMVAQVACFILLPFWCMHDLMGVWKDMLSETRPVYFHWSTVAIVLTSGTLNFMQNLVTFTLIHRMAALSYAVANATKRIVIITVSLISLRNPVTPMNVFGMMLAIVGVFGYNRAKMWQKEHDDKGNLLPVSTQDHIHPSMSYATLSDATLYQRYRLEPDPEPVSDDSATAVYPRPHALLTIGEEKTSFVNGFFRRNSVRPASGGRVNHYEDV